MLVGLVHWAIFIYVGLFATARLSFAAGESLKLKIIYSSFTGAYAPLWLAVEDRLGRKYGLDFEAVYAGRARPQIELHRGFTRTARMGEIGYQFFLVKFDIGRRFVLRPLIDAQHIDMLHQI